MIKEFEPISILLDQYCSMMHSFFQKETDEKEFDKDLHQFFITLVIKNVDILHSSNLLFKNSHLETSFHSLCLLFRGAILDSIIGLYIVNFIVPNKSDDEQEDIRKQINILNIDQIKRTLSYTKKKVENMTPNDKENYCQNINSKYGNFLKKPITSTNLSPVFISDDKFPSTAKLIEGSRMPTVSESLYDSYIFYSKFEHIGYDTYNFYSRIYDANSRLVEVKQLEKIIMDFVALNKAFLIYFNPQDQNLVEQINDLTDVIINEIQS